MKARPSLTFVAAEPPMPPTGGGTRTFHFVKAIAAVSRCSLYVLFPIEKDKLPASILAGCQNVQCATSTFSAKIKNRLRNLTKDIRLLVAPWTFPKSEAILAGAFFITNTYEGNNPIRMVYLFFLKRSLALYTKLLYRSGYSLPAKSLERLNQYRELESSILADINKSHFLWIDFSSLLPFFKMVRNEYPQLKIICNAHNIEYRVLERQAELSKNSLERKWYILQAAILKKAELEGFAGCDLIITCSQEDKNEILNNVPNARVEVVPNGVDLDYFIPHSMPAPEPSLLFTGTMTYEPNRDAVEYFIEYIFGHVTKLHPTCKFIIAGANAQDVFKKHAGNPQIEIISSPSDMRPLYNKAWIVVVPLRSGSGTRLKILEAMAMEKPVVSTTVGAEGIMMKDKNELLIADDDEEFADKINLLIADKNLATCIATLAKEKVSERYNWRIIDDLVGEAIAHFNLSEN